MQKRKMMMGLVLLASSVVMAGTAGTRVTKANEGWFIGTGVGTQFYIGDMDNRQNTGYRFSAGFEGTAGKWISPKWAVRLQATAARVTGGSADGKADAMNLWHIHADVLTDVLGWLGNKDANRLYTPMPLAGIGFAKVGVHGPGCATFTLGLLNRFNVSEHIDLNVEIKGSLLSDKMDGFKGGSRGEGTAMLTAGFTYKF